MRMTGNSANFAFSEVLPRTNSVYFSVRSLLPYYAHVQVTDRKAIFEVKCRSGALVTTRQSDIVNQFGAFRLEVL